MSEIISCSIFTLISVKLVLYLIQNRLKSAHSDWTCIFIPLKEEEFTTDETTNNEIKNPHVPSSSTLSKGTFSDPDWDSDIDDTFLEAIEDAELAEAAENYLLSYNSGADEIPDELIIEVLQE